eukprot:TRINITY_DN2735_c0_g1_i1.p2 TRINITY_DN2735_c0_g1~~TRINITY_DN2735_c0_g1_i1.p2  ORF type:complete len:278 (+),score=79.74 TRINITY_DN2735_c0_g1_i1:145-978(+)
MADTPSTSGAPCSCACSSGETNLSSGETNLATPSAAGAQKKCCAAGNRCECGDACACKPGSPSCGGCAQFMCKCTAEAVCGPCSTYMGNASPEEVLSRFSESLRREMREKVTPCPQPPAEELSAWFEEVRQRMPDAPWVEVSDVLAREGPVVLVDVRSLAEHSVSVIPGSVHRLEFEAVKEQLPPRTFVAVHCTVGGRAAKYAAALTEASGEQQVGALLGSTMQWQALGLEFATSRREHASTRTRSLNPFGERGANLMRDGYEAVSAPPSSSSSSSS